MHLLNRQITLKLVVVLVSNRVRPSPSCLIYFPVPGIKAKTRLLHPFILKQGFSKNPSFNTFIIIVNNIRHFKCSNIKIIYRPQETGLTELICFIFLYGNGI